MKEINNLDKQFLDDYWSRYKKIIFDSRNDKEIINFRDQYLKMSDFKGLDLQKSEYDIFNNYRGRWSKI